MRGEDKLTLYREIFAHSSDAIAIIGTDGRYLEQNTAHQELIGYGDGEIRGRTPELHLGAERYQEVATFLDTQGLYRKDVISTTKSGVQLDIELSAFTVRDGGGSPVCYVGIKRDISQRKRMEEALSSSRRRARRSIDRSTTRPRSRTGRAHGALSRRLGGRGDRRTGRLPPPRGQHPRRQKRAELLVELVALRAATATPEGPIQGKAAPGRGA
jgi:PAS domain S-box-containing protein